MQKVNLEDVDFVDRIGILGRQKDLIFWIYESFSSMWGSSSNQQSLYGGASVMMLTNGEAYSMNKEGTNL